MDQLFAPWRIEWVERDRDNDADDRCVFCTFADPAVEDRERLVVARTGDAYVLLNNYPYNPGHLLIIPHQHTGRYQALEPAASDAMEALTRRSLEALEAAFDPDGFNTGCNLGSAAAGGSLGDHVHRHVVPRWSGDTNFMPVLTETKVIVQALDDTYSALHSAFAEQPGTTTAGEGAVILEDSHH